MTTLIVQQKLEKFSIVQSIQSVVATFQVWMDRYHQRRQLAQMDAHLLRDIGLNAHQVAIEVNKPFWKK